MLKQHLPGQSTHLRGATRADQAWLTALLSTGGLPTDDVAVDRQHFILAFQGEALVGAVGLEVAGEAGLLRSLCVAPPVRGQGLGKALVARAEELARERGLGALFLLTTGAQSFFLGLGYALVERATAPQDITALPQFRSVCPSTAACLSRRLSAGQGVLPPA